MVAGLTAHFGGLRQAVEEGKGSVGSVAQGMVDLRSATTKEVEGAKVEVRKLTQTVGQLQTELQVRLHHEQLRLKQLTEGVQESFAKVLDRQKNMEGSLKSLAPPPVAPQVRGNPHTTHPTPLQVQPPAATVFDAMFAGIFQTCCPDVQTLCGMWGLDFDPIFSGVQPLHVRLHPSRF